MPLPPKDGWIIDFASARAIYAAHDNELINAVVGMCGAGQLFCCSCEGSYFAEHPGLRPPFIDDQDCRLDLSDEIIDRLEALAHAVNGGIQGKAVLPGLQNSHEIVATAITHDYGVISNKTSDVVVTIRDMCLHCQVPILTTAEFKAAL